MVPALRTTEPAPAPALSDIASAASRPTSADRPPESPQGDASGNLLASNPVAAQPVLDATSLATSHAKASAASTQTDAIGSQQRLSGDASGNLLASNLVAAQTVLNAKPLATARAIDPTRVGSGQAPDALPPIGDIAQGAIVGRSASTDQAAAAPVQSVPAAPVAQGLQAASTLPNASTGGGGVVGAFAPASLTIAKPLRTVAAPVASQPTLTSDAIPGAADPAPDADTAGEGESQDAAPSSQPAATLTDDKAGAGAGVPTDASIPAPSPLNLTFTPAHLVAPPRPDASVGTAAPAVTNDTVASLAGQTASQANAGASQFQIELHPFGLGRVDVSVQIDSRGQLSAAFAFDRPQTAEALGARSGELQKALEQAGFSLGDAGLSFSVAHVAAQSPTQANPQAQGGGSASPASHVASASSQTAQGFNAGGQGFGQGARRDAPADQSHANGRGRAFAAAAETAVAADPSRTPAYARRAAAGVDIRI